MCKTYQRFLETGIDLCRWGLNGGKRISAIFVPQRRDVYWLDWGRWDTFCFVRGFGEKVFAVSPMNGGSDCVHPVAENFEDFLRLLMACGGESAIEQAWQWSREQFDGFMEENRPTDEAKAAAEQIVEKMGLEPMDDPWGLSCWCSRGSIIRGYRIPRITMTRR